MERNHKIDILRAYAIITVIIGHSIQFGQGPSPSFFEDYVFKFIYSFHMPLFMLLSGYLFYLTLNRHSFSSNVCSRFTTLFVPIIMWNIFPFIMQIYHNPPATVYYLPKIYLSTMIRNSWFLWAIFYCSFVVLIVNRFFKDRIFIYILGLLLTFIIPDSYNLALYKFMYPYFMIGYFYHKHCKKITDKNVSPQMHTVLSCAAVMIFVILLCFFNHDSYIYTTGYTLAGKEVMKQLSIDIYRFAIGLVGSITMIIFASQIYNKLNDAFIKILSTIGANSLGIYMVSGIIFEYALPGLTNNVSGIHYLLAALESIIILALSLLFSLCLKKCSITNVLFLGGRK